MKIKTSELIGPALDWAVAKLLEEDDRKITLIRPTSIGWVVEREVEFDSAPNFERFGPSRSWAQGGPIIEREKIVFEFYPDGGHANGGEWLANTPAYKTDAGVPLEEEYGPSPLIAAMRCYVASKLGDEVDVPEELV